MNVKSGNKKKSFIHKVLLYVLRSFSNPLTLITIFGPIVVINLSFVYLKVKFNSNSDPYFLPLKEMVTKNAWTEPMADFNVQFIVLIIVFVFAIYDGVSSFYGLIKDHKLSEVKSKILSDIPTLLFIIVTIGFILTGVAFLLLGSFSSPENIKLFKENAEYFRSIGWTVFPPPFRSNIVWARAAIVLFYIPVSSYLLNNKLPIIFNDLNGKPVE